jgi:YD repeat-containing protein
MSEREKAGLRGPVERCTEQRVSPAVGGIPEMKFSDTTEYDPEGRILRTSNTNPDGSKWVRTNTYDSQGRLLKTISEIAGRSAEETTYTYDEVGRIIGITANGQASLSTIFEYDDHGRKTRIVSSKVKPSSPNADSRKATGVNLESDDLSMVVPDGGIVKTLYNEHDQAIESRIYEAGGQLKNRLVRTYDAKGRAAETKLVVENPESILPAETREKILAESGGSAADLKEHLNKILGGHQGMFRTYSNYDAEGRVIEKRQQIGASLETVTKISYNDHGDKIEEKSTTSGDPNPGENARSSNVSSTASVSSSSDQSEVNYTYRYDSFGNWTQQTITSRSSQNDPWTVSAVYQRKITYY